ncbi:MAG TPA: TonB-dependent receptor [Sphingobium sp.]|uniref:TonB-dependent receptor n=1 Tax=Sphingobium sp. TaxID=1912891 RepID=UPI002ED180D3
MTNFRRKFICGGAISAIAAVLASPAMAQSTGSQDAEAAIVVHGTRQNAIDGFKIPDAPKAKAMLTQELIERRQPGQTIFDTINLVPGVNFTNADPYGGGGGNLRIRGFDGARISATFDGIQVNDSGNYAVYTNQQLDPELIQDVTVNFGATDVDSPTASASGGTVNYRTRLPKDKLGAMLTYSHGSFNYNRVIGVIDTGEFTSFGTKAFFAASRTKYDQYRGPGTLEKTQFNARIYQPLGDNGDFLSLAGHYNRNRNAFYRRVGITDIRTRLPGAIPDNSAISPATPLDLGTLNKGQLENLFGNNYDASCQLSRPGAGAQNDTSLCGSYYGYNINPSNTANVRFQSRFTATDKLIFTLDAAYQYTKANGGGSRVLSESSSQWGAGGVDINRDGDRLDSIRVYFPSNTQTHRLSAVASARYDFDDNNLIRLAYTYDRARHRQTGAASLLSPFGQPADPFAPDSYTDGLVLDQAGNIINKRNRLSYAILHQVSGEYRGKYLEDRLNVQVGVRAPFFKRNLNNYCWTQPGSSNDAYCTSLPAATVAAANPTYAAPYNGRILNYSAVLPNIGVTYNFFDRASVFASYSKGISAPRTDNLYAFDGVKIRPTAEVRPEKTDTFDLGVRYTSSKIQAQLAGWLINFKDRIISSQTKLDDGSDINTDRNVGKVQSKGVDFSLAYQPIKQVSLYGFASYIDAKLKENVLSSSGAILTPTAGKFVAETPQWQFGGRAQVNLDPVSVGAQFKYVGKRYLTDINDVISPSYTTVDLDARVSLAKLGLEKTFFQLNVINLFDKLYFANLSTNVAVTNSPQLEFGAPRTITGSVRFEF